jgi:sulfite exporter TauE/SafE
LNTWASVVVASLLGSLHCVGMCGGLVGLYATAERAHGASRWTPHAAYHLSRLVSYSLLGAVAGSLGSALDRFGSPRGVADLGLLLASLTLVFWGLPSLFSPRPGAALLQLGRAAPQRPWLVRRLQGFFVALADRAKRQPPIWRAGALGVSSALLPCGWLYAFVVLAAGTGSWSAGAGLLAAFWAGTVPGLLGLGLGLRRLAAPLRARLPRLSAVLVLLVCAFNIASRWPLASAGEGPDASSAAATESCHGTH